MCLCEHTDMNVYGKKNKHDCFESADFSSAVRLYGKIFVPLAPFIQQMQLQGHIKISPVMKWA